MYHTSNEASLIMNVQSDRKLGLIEQMLPDEMLLHVFQRLSVTNLGIAQCVSKQWRSIGSTPSLWRSACLEAFYKPGEHINAAAALKPYKNSWKEMFLRKPHLRFDGIYVSRNTYIKTGVAEWRVSNPVHLVCYFRYIRFLPDGTLILFILLSRERERDIDAFVDFFDHRPPITFI